MAHRFGHTVCYVTKDQCSDCTNQEAQCSAYLSVHKLIDNHTDYDAYEYCDQPDYGTSDCHASLRVSSLLSGKEISYGASVRSAIRQVARPAKRRGTDDVDIRTLAQRKYNEIEWDLVKSLTESEIEYQKIRSQMDALYRMQLKF